MLTSAHRALWEELDRFFSKLEKSKFIHKMRAKCDQKELPPTEEPARPHGPDEQT